MYYFFCQQNKQLTSILDGGGMGWDIYWFDYDFTYSPDLYTQNYGG